MSKPSVWKLPVLLILFFWAWQVIAYRAMVPRSGLAYGWFKTPGGHAAGVWVLDIPIFALLSTMAIDATVGSFQIWKEGRRFRIAGLWLWCSALSVIFAAPSLFLDFQGNASIFL